MIDLEEIEKCFYTIFNVEPPKELLDYCGDYYSPYYYLFYLLGDNKTAVELGVDQGRGCAAFSLGGANTFGIDHTKKIAIEKTGHLFTFIQKDTLPIPNEVPDKIDLLHIDTEHSYSQAQAEFQAYQSRLNKPSVVFFDDLHAQDDGIMKYFLTLNYLKIIDDRLHPSCGFGLILYE